ncbi:MAG TPA: cob(I)yrinic acid a,c-diamide adenosyltransferase [Longilinea sp.]|nr:cob(I)yrinic acid a,c-diamide adenosyltransferase [Longilinea sp.]
MTPLYSRAGDDGMTDLLGEGRVAKSDLRMEVLGTIDEASAALGLARSLSKIEDVKAAVTELQRGLYHVMAEVAATAENASTFESIGPDQVVMLEEQIETFNHLVSMPGGFILPGDTPAAAAMDLARAIVRRAERRAVELFNRGDLKNEQVLCYLNRFSSLCFVLEIRESQGGGISSPTLAKNSVKNKSK